MPENPPPGTARPGNAQPVDPEPAPVSLGVWPTPVEPAPRLATAAGLAADALWIKRDDLSGLGGGNKVRKLPRTGASGAGTAPFSCTPGDCPACSATPPSRN